MGRDSRRIDKREEASERGDKARARERQEACEQIAEGVLTYYDAVAEASAYAPCLSYPNCRVCGPPD